jgi:putative endonuclease
MVFDHHMAKHVVYILRCSDDSYYVGSTHDLDERLERHREGNAAKWTAARLPVEIVYSEFQETELLAHHREAQIKRWSRSKKERLIRGEWTQFQPPP